MKNKIKENLQKGKNFVSDVAAQWKTPARGNYVSYKEIVNYSIGGMGKEMVLLLATYLGLGIGNTLFGSVLNIRPTHIQLMNTIVVIIDVFFIAIRAKILDNTNTRWGRFRPYIALVPIPLFIICTTFMYLPFDTMTYFEKLVIIFTFSTGVVLVRPYFEGPMSNLGNVITPNGKERIKVLSIYSILYSAAPTVYGVLINVLADQTGGYTDIRTYRYVIVPVAAVGIVLSMFAAFGCKERYIKPKGYEPKAKLFQSTVEIFKNKYWWLRTLSTWLAFMEWAVGNMFLWSFVYGSQNMSEYAVYNLFIGEAATIAMLLTPFLLTKWGNRKLLVFQNTMNIVFLAIILFTFNYPVIFFFVWFGNSLVNYFSVIYKPVLTAEVNDYQQYISGKRLDNAMSFANAIGLPITISTAYFVPALFEALGITTDYDILFEPKVRSLIFTVLTVCAIIGAFLNLAPFLFYDYSRQKHKMIVRVLRFRAMLSDRMNGHLDANTIKLGIEGYHEYLEILNAEMPNIHEYKVALHNAKKLPHKTDEEKEIRRQEIKKAKKDLMNAKDLKASKKELFLFTKDLEKFDSEKAQIRLKFEGEIAKCNPTELVNFKQTDAYQNLMLNVENYSNYKNYIKKFDRHLDKMIAKINKYYPNGLVVPNKQEVIDAENMPHNTKEEIKARFLAIKNAVKKQKVYEKAVGFYLECCAYCNEYLSRQYLEEIEGMYEKAVEEVEEQYRINAEKAKQEKINAKKAVEELKLNKKLKKYESKINTLTKKLDRASEKNKCKIESSLLEAKQVYDSILEKISALQIKEENND